MVDLFDLGSWYGRLQVLIKSQSNFGRQVRDLILSYKIICDRVRSQLRDLCIFLDIVISLHVVNCAQAVVVEFACGCGTNAVDTGESG